MQWEQDNKSVGLRPLADEDLPIFFQQQLDPEANQMAAFTRKNPADRTAFETHWTRIRHDREILIRTILFDGQIAGHVASYGPANEKEVTYWLGKEFWNKGIATQALSLFLADLPIRPISARAAGDNLASIRVLQKCGFKICGHDRFFANARGREIEEVVLKLE